MRLVKYLSTSGIASRRASERIIAQGRVSVNGLVITDPALSVSETDPVICDGIPVKPVPSDKLIYIAFNKPAGVVSTMQLGDEEGVPLTDFVDLKVRLYPIGRLDRDSSGLILLTNDGELTHRLTHPSHKIEKEYSMRINRPIAQQDFRRLKRGIKVEGRAVEIDKIIFRKGGKILITIHEGRKRILRRLFQELGYRVVQLKRNRIGPMRLGKLSLGRWRHLTKDEIATLKSL